MSEFKKASLLLGLVELEKRYGELWRGVKHYEGLIKRSEEDGHEYGVRSYTNSMNIELEKKASVKRIIDIVSKLVDAEELSMLREIERKYYPV
jgi:hypothetical protein